jgi:hypothetical protein
MSSNNKATTTAATAVNAAVAAAAVADAADEEDEALQAKFLSDFTLLRRDDVLWGEMDAFGHVNNTRYLSYIEQARLAYLTALRVLALQIAKEEMAAISAAAVSVSTQFSKSESSGEAGCLVTKDDDVGVALIDRAVAASAATAAEHTATVAAAEAVVAADIGMVKSFMSGKGVGPVVHKLNTVFRYPGSFNHARSFSKRIK